MKDKFIVLKDGADDTTLVVCARCDTLADARAFVGEMGTEGINYHIVRVVNANVRLQRKVVERAKVDWGDREVRTRKAKAPATPTE